MQQTTGQLRRALSDERLNSYRRTPADTDIDLLACYVWNVALCETSYPTLHYLEVALRNSINEAASLSFENWLAPFSLILLDNERGKVDAVIEKLVRRRKPVNVGRIVAALEFGFWTSLFKSDYDQRLWPRLLIPVFPHMPARNRTRKYLSNRLTVIRHFRNRVFHHEPIWHRPHLVQIHEDILETVGWIDPTIRDLAAAVDRFPAVYQNGMHAYDASVERILAGPNR